MRAATAISAGARNALERMRSSVSSATPGWCSRAASARASPKARRGRRRRPRRTATAATPVVGHAGRGVQQRLDLGLARGRGMQHRGAPAGEQRAQGGGVLGDHGPRLRPPNRIGNGTPGTPGHHGGRPAPQLECGRTCRRTPGAADAPPVGVRDRPARPPPGRRPRPCCSLARPLAARGWPLFALAAVPSAATVRLAGRRAARASSTATSSPATSAGSPSSASTSTCASTGSPP